ncbi:O-methyltransferase [Methanoculleus oceani]|uniref:Uncharacterized protein n=1 Tax=Methanoculleus oceani TaxID=2184756 RepID=A0ABD4TAA7_9EURY|nr:O-methyltransferase [Methanoculleus sp. CWC-02]MCM2464760.1 hypothetical protein [Methanoculleus sp. CWC-02]
MSSPPYHLRKNKAADRFAFIEAIRRLSKLGGDLDEYTYYGMGGPYLEDMRLIYEFCPEVQMVSIEEDPDVYLRQGFHLPCGIIQLKNCDMCSFIAEYESLDSKSIFWLDYTGLDYTHFEDFMTLLGKVAQGSMVKITLRANSRDYGWDKPEEERARLIEEFHRKFSEVLPNPNTDLPRENLKFTSLVQEMLQIAAQEALPAVADLAFHPVSSFYYNDGTWMFTLTGVIWPRKDRRVVKAFKSWEFANLTWENPKLIKIPDLSTKERLHLQKLLPCNGQRGKILSAELGYLIDENAQKTEEALEQYAAFHRYSPYFLRGTP